MSSQAGVDFGHEFGEAYGEVVATWGEKLKGATKLTPSIKEGWASDLRAALEPKLITALMEYSEEWKKLGEYAKSEVVLNFAKAAAKAALSEDSFDLLERLRLMAQEPGPDETVTAAISVAEALARVGQTVAQIYDMAKDRFDRLMGNIYRRREALTGRRSWRVVGAKSRHSRLDGQVKNEGENFVYRGNLIYGPRPAGGSPEHWSNCSCYLVYETSGGEWVTLGR